MIRNYVEQNNANNERRLQDPKFRSRHPQSNNEERKT